MDRMRGARRTCRIGSLSEMIKTDEISAKGVRDSLWIRAMRRIQGGYCGEEGSDGGECS